MTAQEKIEFAAKLLREALSQLPAERTFAESNAASFLIEAAYGTDQALRELRGGE